MKDSFPKHHHAFIYSLMHRGAGIALCVWHLPTSHQRHLRLLHSFPLAQEHVTHWTDPGLVSVEVPVISLEGQGWKAGWLQQQTLLPPRPAGWRLRCRGGQGWLPLRPPSWACGRPSSPCVLTRASLWVCLRPHLLFLQGPRSCGIRATLGTSCHLNHSYKDPSANAAPS